jgi:trehalose 6-phosphate phosphatase
MELALFLDIDGTLLDHQSHPDAVKVDETLRGLISAAYFKLGGALALVTGRSIAMADRLFLPLELPVAGLYGVEMRLKPGEPFSPSEESEALTSVIERLMGRFKPVEGIYFERKGAVLAVHTRAAPGHLAALLAAAEEALPELENYRIIAGHAGLELVPIGVAKAAAIERFMSVSPFVGRKPVFIGDDTSDESGFEQVNKVGGVSIRVRPNGPTAARETLPTVAAVHDWIRQTI